MEDHNPTNPKPNPNPNSNSTNNNTKERNSEPARSRWTPKPEQILVLESIFNSGMVNPPKEETVRIRKLLEKFGPVGDANVFYWFQNRRSRSRRRQRQLQAAASVTPPPPLSTDLFTNYGGPQPHLSACTASIDSFGGDVFGFSGQIMGTLLSQSQLLMETTSSSSQLMCSSDASNLHFPSGIITVFINGVATQVAEGPLNVKAMFGEELILVHSSGVPLPFNEFGISFQSLQHGESYFLVPRLS